MPAHLKNSRTFLYLVFGYASFFMLFMLSWNITEKHTNDHVTLLQTNERATAKMHALSELISIVRERTRLTHEMISATDVFEKDELSQQVLALAIDFVLKRRELRSLQLTYGEEAILRDQLGIYPVILEGFENVADLALQDTPGASQQARDILIHTIVPNQSKVLDGFIRIMHGIEEQVKLNTLTFQEKHTRNRNIRNLLLMSILILSLAVVYVVSRNIIRIENRLVSLSTVDPLTGVLNRRSFDHIAELEWKKSLRSGQALSLIMLDVDHFKAYNDHYGHFEGDRCLVQVAEVLQSMVYREDDIVARYGGEEFVILLPNVDAVGAYEVAERMLNSVFGRRMIHAKAENGFVTASLGVATMVATRGQTVTDLVKEADIALYQSKQTGRNRVTVYTPELISGSPAPRLLFSV